MNSFLSDLNPAVLKEIAQWQDHPELGKLLANLQTATDHERFLNFCGEAFLALHLLAHGCELRVEVDTPAGRTCDFEVTTSDDKFYLHLKRVITKRAAARRITVSSRLRYLERIQRPYIVSIRWNSGLDDEQMIAYVAKTAEFIKQAKVGDEFIVCDNDEQEIGGCRIVAPWNGTHVSLAIGFPSGFIDQAPRMRKAMRKAYQQFMPGATNIIIIYSLHQEDKVDFETALLGSHIERWDTHPPRGRRVAHGRADDGFWHLNQFAESALAGWFCLNPQSALIRPQLWFRSDDELANQMTNQLESLLHAKSE